MILNVTPGINLNAVSGPISKSQLNQLGQPVVTLSPGTVVAGDTNFSSLRITDGSYPFVQLTNTAAPTDKKHLKFGLAADGWTYLQRLNDAETAVSSSLLTWDANNSLFISTPINVSTASGTLATFIGSPGVSGFFGLRLLAADASSSQTRIAYLDFANETGQNSAAIWAGIEIDGSSNLRFLTSPDGSRATDRRVERMRVRGDGNVGIGTNTPAGRLHVAGGDMLLENNRKLALLDTTGALPAFICQNDNNFVFYGTTSTGGRSIFSCLMQSDTSPLQVNVPLKIGASGTEIKTVLTTVYTGPTRTLAAGTTASNTITLTGVPNTSVCALTITPTPAAWVDDRIVISARLTGNPNEVKVVWYNPSAVSISLGSEQYRIEATIY